MKNKIRYYRKVYSELYGKDGHMMAELDEEFYCLRAIYINSEEVCTTNFSETDNFRLPEGCWEDSINELEIITEDVFNNTWKSILLEYRNAWEETKLKLKNIKEIKGTIKYFYPQGTIVDIGEIFLGIADYDKCKKVVGSKNMYPRTKVDVRIESFDDLNMWIILSVEKIVSLI